MECIHKFLQILLLKAEEVCNFADNNHKNFQIGGENETKAANVHEIMYNAPSCPRGGHDGRESLVGFSVPRTTNI